VAQESGEAFDRSMTWGMSTTTEWTSVCFGWMDAGALAPLVA
jgi:hypothetical protein